MTPCRLANRFLVNCLRIATTSIPEQEVSLTPMSGISSFFYPSVLDSNVSPGIFRTFFRLQVLAIPWTNVVSSWNIWYRTKRRWFWKETCHVTFRLLAIQACRRSCPTSTALLATWILLNFANKWNGYCALSTSEHVWCARSGELQQVRMLTFRSLSVCSLYVCNNSRTFKRIFTKFSAG